MLRDASVLTAQHHRHLFIFSISSISIFADNEQNVVTTGRNTWLITFDWIEAAERWWRREHIIIWSFANKLRRHKPKPASACDHSLKGYNIMFHRGCSLLNVRSTEHAMSTISKAQIHWATNSLRNRLFVAQCIRVWLAVDIACSVHLTRRQSTGSLSIHITCVTGRW